ncbi:hypothetical protein PHYBOEH_002209 [Phytophthora boehmeriae]|uniref:Uncharacterized protein n=1 Tax=Phytophthora boehmeriae TaxID=109152 RepID=A0A8T1WR26_9STRA|nr:hypothetical protein PHYBOEH_002209 [Phytophthora boehmeriae]
MDALEALKNEGNALFQQKRFEEAVRVYSSVLDKLEELKSNDDAAVRLDTAVRLNRAWAWILMPGRTEERTLITAEQDCSTVLERDPGCVKAFYRRALARERRGHWKLAMEDAVVMKRLEPTNPSVGPLVERLHLLMQDEEDLEPKMRDCTVSVDEDTNGPALDEEAEQAWRTLQEDEMKLQRTCHSTARKSAVPQRKPSEATKTKPQHLKGEISQKTEDLWASLRREETTTIAKAYPKARKKKQRQIV